MNNGDELERPPLLEKPSWYKRWHESGWNNIFHWIGLAAFVLVVFLILQTKLSSYTSFLALTANQGIPTPKVGGTNDHANEAATYGPQNASDRALLNEHRADHPIHEVRRFPAAPAAGSDGSGYVPSQLRHFYGFDQVTFQGGAIQGDGSGQTIAIVDAYDQPNIVSDLQTFSTAYGLPMPPSFKVVNQTGGSTLPPYNSLWGLEISLDVEWAHAIAPAANILLVEANSNGLGDLLTAVDYARKQPGVSVVSMSWGASEFGSETNYDSYFTTPSGHSPVTFIVSSGDTAIPKWPATSPNVLAIGGTTLATLNTAGDYTSEAGWSKSGGGISLYEPLPSYQNGLLTGGTKRYSPDVAYDAGSYVAVYDSSYGGWIGVGGTSMGSPQWSGLAAIANQGRAVDNLASLNGPTQLLPAIYSMAATNYHDITTGSTGSNSATAGYDLVTGRGTPFANLVIDALVNLPGATPTPTPSPTPSPTPTPIPDPIAPVVSVTSPADGSTVAKGASVNITATASDNIAVSKVEFYTNNSLKCTDTAAPYACTWKVSKAGGKGATNYSVMAKAYDAAANTATSVVSVVAK